MAEFCLHVEKKRKRFFRKIQICREDFGKKRPEKKTCLLNVAARRIESRGLSRRLESLLITIGGLQLQSFEGKEVEQGILIQKVLTEGEKGCRGTREKKKSPLVIRALTKGRR